MPQLSEVISAHQDTVLLYGVSGSGKTTLWGRMAEYERYSPIFCADFDLRLTSLRASLDEKLLSNIYFEEFRDSNVQGDSYVRLESISRNLGALNAKHGVVFKTLVIDSGTFLMDSIMARVQLLDGGKSARDNPHLQHYMAQQSCLRELIQRFTSCGLHFVFTAHEDTDKDEVTGRMFKNLALTGKSAQKTPGYFNELWHTEVKAPKPTESEPSFVVRTRSDAIYSARTSYKFLTSVEPQTEIWKKINGNCKAL